MSKLDVRKDAFDVNELLAGLDEKVPTLHLPDYSLRNIYRDEANRVLWLEDGIDETTMDLVRVIMEYNRIDKDIPVEERKPIKLFIDTNGGAISVMAVLVSAIKMSKTPVWTINWCECLSAGSHVFAAGHKRLAMPNSIFLIHSGSCTFTGTAEQTDNAKKFYDALSKRADEQLLANSEIPTAKLKKKSPFDWWITAEEAVEMKLADKIIESYDEIF